MLLIILTVCGLIACCVVSCNPVGELLTIKAAFVFIPDRVRQLRIYEDFHPFACPSVRLSSAWP